MNKKWIYTELTGLLFTAAGFWFMRQLYRLTNYGLAGVLFGCVNHSAWETAKALILPYLVWGGIELLCLGKYMRCLCVAKTAALWVMTLSFLGLSALSELAGAAFETSDLIYSALAAAAATAVSVFMTRDFPRYEHCFPVALCLLFLLMAFYFSFTPFPPRLALFADRISGQFGIPPTGYDFGADML